METVIHDLISLHIENEIVSDKFITVFLSIANLIPQYLLWLEQWNT